MPEELSTEMAKLPPAKHKERQFHRGGSGSHHQAPQSPGQQASNRDISPINSKTVF